MFEQFSHSNYHSICDNLAANDPDLALILQNHGYPPLWSRPNSFETLVHIILEQQVSLASALSALNKLRERVQQITPARVLLLTDEEFRACYVSRQKTIYIKYLAEAIVSGQINLAEMEQMPDDIIRTKLTALKGIGNWTVDVYLMHALQRSDLFPLGDIALVNSLKHVKQLHPKTTKDEMLTIAENWRPYRTIAAMILWHAYIQRKGIKVYS